MTTQLPRFAGLAVAFVAGTLLSSTVAWGQGDPRRASGERRGPGSLNTKPLNSTLLFDAAMRAGISGMVRDRVGRPQIGALVQLLNARSELLARTFTDDRGRYSLPRLGAGLYQVEASNTLFLPALRPDLRLLADSKAIVNLTLSTVSEALNWLPAQPRDPRASRDDWDWTLRLATNRPLLRFRDTTQDAASGRKPVPEPVIMEGEQGQSVRLEVRQGPNRFGEGGMAQQLAWRAPSEPGRALLLRAGTATEPGEGGFGLGRLSATVAYRQQLSLNRSWSTVATVSERPSIHSATGNGLALVRIRSASTTSLGDLATFSAGTEVELARLGEGPAALASHPFMSLTVGAGRTKVEYRVSTAPSMTGAESLEGSAEETPVPIANNGRLALEAGLHQELRLHRRLGSGWTAEAVLFDDTLRDLAVQGAVHGSEAAIDSEDVLYDPGTGIIAVSGHGYSHGGVMGLLRDQLSPDTWFSLRYAMGDAESLAGPGTVVGSAASSETGPAVISGATPMFEARPASSVAVAAGTHLPVIHTAIRAGYDWQPIATLSKIAPFAGDSDDPKQGAYLGVSVRQPIHFQHAGQGRLEAILDVRNLLAQGYRPFLSKDGTMVYFAQSQRCFAAGFAFSF